MTPFPGNGSLTGPAEQKAALRALLREKRAAVPAWTRAFWDRAIAQRLALLLPEEGEVFFYVGTGFEIATRDAIAGRLRRGDVCVPLCGAGGTMSARRIRSLDELRTGRYGLPEPPADAPEGDPRIAVVPGLAFSLSGDRIGWGGGYYDRWLAAHPDCLTVGLCYEAFLMDLPHTAADRRVGVILTERRSISCS